MRFAYERNLPPRRQLPRNRGLHDLMRVVQGYEWAMLNFHAKHTSGILDVAAILGVWRSTL